MRRIFVFFDLDETLYFKFNFNNHNPLLIAEDKEFETMLDHEVAFAHQHNVLLDFGVITGKSRIDCVVVDFTKKFSARFRWHIKDNHGQISTQALNQNPSADMTATISAHRKESRSSYSPSSAHFNFKFTRKPFDEYNPEGRFCSFNLSASPDKSFVMQHCQEFFGISRQDIFLLDNDAVLVSEMKKRHFSAKTVHTQALRHDKNGYTLKNDFNSRKGRKLLWEQLKTDVHVTVQEMLGINPVQVKAVQHNQHTRTFNFFWKKFTRRDVQEQLLLQDGNSEVINDGEQKAEADSDYCGCWPKITRS